MTTTVSSPTRTTTARARTTSGNRTFTTSRLSTLFRSVWSRLRWVPGSTDSRDHLDPIHRHYNTVHPMHLR